MAFTKLFSLAAFASCALLLSSSSYGVNAIAIEDHGRHAARHHALGQNVALKKRSSNSGRCKPRPTSTSTTTQSTSKPTSSAQNQDQSSSKTQTSSSAKSTSTQKTSTSTSSKPQGTPTGNNAGNTGNVIRGAAWAVDNNWAPKILGGEIKWYHHWAQPVVPQLDSIEFCPMYWGPAQTGAWDQMVQYMDSNLPSHIIGQNECDISSQCNQSPQDAANDWMSKIHPYGAKGVQLVGPSIAFSIDWYQQFLTAINNQGGYVDKINLHWYGTPDQIDQLMSYAKQAHSQFGKNIWFTEIGVTTASGASSQDVLSFMQNVLGQFSSLGFIERVSWFAFFASSDPPDGFASGNNAVFDGSGNLNSVGEWYVFNN